MSNFDFGFEIEIADMTGDTDRQDLALMKRFETFRPFDMAFFGGWTEEADDMTTRLGRP